MISVADVVDDGDLTAPKPFQILRSIGVWTDTGFQSSTVILNQYGPVQNATNMEVNMLPEADRVSSVMAFWCTTPIKVTRSTDPSPPTVQGQTPAGSGSVFTLNPPVARGGQLMRNGLLLIPGVDYTLSADGDTITLITLSGGALYFVSSTINYTAPAASDILVYPPNGDQFRVLGVNHDPGSGYWKALAARMSAV